MFGGDTGGVCVCVCVWRAAGKAVCQEEDLFLSRLAIRAKNKAAIRLETLERYAAELKRKELIEKSSLCSRTRGDGDQAATWMPHPW